MDALNSVSADQAPRLQTENSSPPFIPWAVRRWPLGLAFSVISGEVH